MKKQNKLYENSGSKKLLNEIFSDINLVEKSGITVGWFIDQIEKIGATSFKVVLDEECEDGDEKALRYNNYLSMKNLSINYKSAMVKLNFSSYLPSKVARDAANGFSLKQFENGFAKNLGSEYRDFILTFHLSDGSFLLFEPVMPAQFLPYKKNPKCCIVVMKHTRSVLKKQDVPLDKVDS